MPHIAKSRVKRQAPFPHSVLFLCFSFGIRRFYFTGQAALVSAWKSGAFPPVAGFKPGGGRSGGRSGLRKSGSRLKRPD
jgi:hypothetical protein